MEQYAIAVAARKAVRARTASTEIGDSLTVAALSLLESEGLAALTVRSVATHAGVAPMGVYSRFGSKAGLLEALFVHGFVKLQSAIDRAQERDALQRLRTGCLHYREFAIAHPQLYHLMFEQMMNLELSPDALDVARGTFTTLVDLVATAMQAGQLDDGDPVEVAQQLWSAMHGAVSLEIADVHFAVDRQTNFESLIGSLLRGLSGR